MTTNLLPEFVPGMPEIFLLIFSLVLLMIGVFRQARDVNFVIHASIIALFLTGVMSFLSGDQQQIAFNGMFMTNKFTQLAKSMILFASATVLFTSQDHLESYQLKRFEYPVLLMLSSLGMMIMVSANDLLALFLGLEMQSLALYVLVAMARKQSLSNEAALKYFVLGALATAFILYGSSLIYGYAGTIEFAGIAKALSVAGHEKSTLMSHGLPLSLMVSFLMLLIGIGFKLSLVPFHMWTPDVYEGSPTPVTVFLASAPKIAALCMLVQVLSHAFYPMGDIWKTLVMALAILSITLGAFAALFQKNIKRLLAYSTISHMGFAILGLLAGSALAYENLMLYVMLYVVMTLGIFTALLCLKRNGRPVESIQELSGLSQETPFIALCMTVLLFSLAGVPPFAGFFAKLSVLKNAVDAQYYGTAVLAVLASVVSAAYYLRIIKAIYFDGPQEGELSMKVDLAIPRSNLLVLGVMTGLTFFYVLFPGIFSNHAHQAAQYLAH